MRNLAAAAVMAAALAGCQGLTIPPVPAGAFPIVDSIIQATRTACRFVPAFDFVRELLNLNWPPLTTAQDIAEDYICPAVAPAPAGIMEGSPTDPVVRGVPVQGFFV